MCKNEFANFGFVSGSSRLNRRQVFRLGTRIEKQCSVDSPASHSGRPRCFLALKGAIKTTPETSVILKGRFAMHSLMRIRRGNFSLWSVMLALLTISATSLLPVTTVVAQEDATSN